MLKLIMAFFIIQIHGLLNAHRFHLRSRHGVGHIIERANEFSSWRTFIVDEPHGRASRHRKSHQYQTKGRGKEDIRFVDRTSGFSKRISGLRSGDVTGGKDGSSDLSSASRVSSDMLEKTRHRSYDVAAGGQISLPVDHLYRNPNICDLDILNNIQDQPSNGNRHQDETHGNIRFEKGIYAFPETSINDKEINLMDEQEHFLNKMNGHPDIKSGSVEFNKRTKNEDEEQDFMDTCHRHLTVATAINDNEDEENKLHKPAVHASLKKFKKFRNILSQYERILNSKEMMNDITVIPIKINNERQADNIEGEDSSETQLKVPLSNICKEFYKNEIKMWSPTTETTLKLNQMSNAIVNLVDICKALKCFYSATNSNDIDTNKTTKSNLNTFNGISVVDSTTQLQTTSTKISFLETITKRIGASSWKCTSTSSNSRTNSESYLTETNSRSTMELSTSKSSSTRLEVQKKATRGKPTCAGHKTECNVIKSDVDAKSDGIKNLTSSTCVTDFLNKILPRPLDGRNSYKTIGNWRQNLKFITDLKIDHEVRNRNRWAVTPKEIADYLTGGSGDYNDYVKEIRNNATSTPEKSAKEKIDTTKEDNLNLSNKNSLKPYIKDGKLFRNMTSAGKSSPLKNKGRRNKHKKAHVKGNEELVGEQMVPKCSGHKHMRKVFWASLKPAPDTDLVLLYAVNSNTTHQPKQILINLKPERANRRTEIKYFVGN